PDLPNPTTLHTSFLKPLSPPPTYTLSLHDALPISADAQQSAGRTLHELAQHALRVGKRVHSETGIDRAGASIPVSECTRLPTRRDRKSTRLNSSHVKISYAVFCLKKKKKATMKYLG